MKYIIAIIILVTFSFTHCSSSRASYLKDSKKGIVFYENWSVKNSKTFKQIFKESQKWDRKYHTLNEVFYMGKHIGFLVEGYQINQKYRQGMVVYAECGVRYIVYNLAGDEVIDAQFWQNCDTKNAVISATQTNMYSAQSRAYGQSGHSRKAKVNENDPDNYRTGGRTTRKNTLVMGTKVEDSYFNFTIYDAKENAVKEYLKLVVNSPATYKEYFEKKR